MNWIGIIIASIGWTILIRYGIGEGWITAQDPLLFITACYNAGQGVFDWLGEW